MNARFRTRNIRNLYQAGSLRTGASELAKYNLALVAVQEVRWDKCGCQAADDYTFFMEMGMLIMTYG